MRGVQKTGTQQLRMPAPITKATTERPVPKDTSSLAVRLMMETASATVASLAIAPLVSIIDQAITSNASGREKMLPSMMNSFKSLLSNPIRFMKMPSVVIMTGVYTGTYSAANLVDAVMSDRTMVPRQLQS